MNYKSPELIRVGFLLAITPFLMIAAFRLGIHNIEIRGGNAELGGNALGMLLIFFGKFVLLGSGFMMILNPIIDRNALRSPLWITSTFINIVVFGFIGFMAWKIATQLS